MDPVRIDDYLTLNRAALDRLTDVERVHVLSDLAKRAGTWLAHARADAIDELRIAYGSDKAVAAALGVDRVAIATVGDGPMVIAAGGLRIRPALLRRGADLLLEYPAPGTDTRQLMEAMGALKRPGRPSGNLLTAAARRLARAVPRDLGQLRDQMSYEEYRTLSRALAHASDVAAGSNPDTGYARRFGAGQDDTDNEVGD